MAMQTYTLAIDESETGDGIDVDVYNEDGTIDASTWIGYEDHGVAADRSGDESPSHETEFTADVMTLGLQIERDDAGFLVRVLGDQDPLAEERLDDEEWGLATE